MHDELEDQARKEAERVDRILEVLEAVDGRSESLMKVLESYHRDCRGFLENGKFLQALEAAFICWAYVDAGLHLGAFRVPEGMRKTFTV